MSDEADDAVLDADQMRDLRTWAVEQLLDYHAKTAGTAYGEHFNPHDICDDAASLVAFVVDGTVPAS